MTEQPASQGRAVRFTAFATIGVLSATQELAGAALNGIEGAEPDLVAEETLCLVSIAAARAAEVGLRSEPDVAALVIPVLLDLPFTYRDYLVGGALIQEEDTSLVDVSEEVYQRLQRKRAFYGAHLAPGQFPGERALREKMALWMGRISPPGLPESPQKRLEKLDLIPLFLTHLKLILGFGRQGAV